MSKKRWKDMSSEDRYNKILSGERSEERKEKIGHNKKFLLVFLEGINDRPISNKSGVEFQVKFDIILANNVISKEQLENFYRIYIESSLKNKNDVRAKLLVRYGQKRVDEYDAKLAARKRREYTKDSLIFCEEYWTKRGYSEEAAKKKIKENSKKASEISHTNKTRKDYRSYTPLCLDYWTKRGYSVEEAEILRRPYISKCSNSLPRMVERHGLELGTEKYHMSKIKRHTTMMERYGVKTILSGQASKESLRVFRPLYQLLRKQGLERGQIYWGIKGSTEYRFNDREKSRVYFADFTIPDKRVVIEYHNTFWHPRNLEEWNSSYYDYETKKLYDEEKEYFIRSQGYDLIVIWNDDKVDYDDLVKRIMKSASN